MIIFIWIRYYKPISNVVPLYLMYLLQFNSENAFNFRKKNWLVGSETVLRNRLQQSKKYNDTILDIDFRYHKIIYEYMYVTS